VTTRALRIALPAGAAVWLTAVAAAVLFPDAASAHGLVGRSDLPLPGWLLTWGAALLLIGSFAGLVLLWTEPKLEGDTWRPAGRTLNAIVTHPATSVFFGVVSALLLLLTIYSGLQGTVAPDRNFSVTFVFVTAWLGVVIVSCIFGDVFRALSPWRAAARAVSGLAALVAGQRLPVPFEYPKWLGRWPAVIGLTGFLWFELVWGQSGFAAAGVSPHDVAVAAVVYSAITFLGMALFGVDAWHEKGETFSVYFGMFASMSVFELRDGQLGRRRVLEGTTRWAGAISGSLALLIVAIGGTTFDGAQEGVLKDAITSTFESLANGGMSPTAALRLTNSLYFAGAIAVVAGIFWAGFWGMKIVSTKHRAGELALKFAHAFIPIALAYLVAHYFSLIVYQEQAQFTYLLSDPLGQGENYFGTANSAIDYTVIGATFIQWVQFGAIVLGHAIALAIGHDRALSVFGTSRSAGLSQIWMLTMMIGFSTLGLYLLTQANA
jgi:hypothetical protein